MAVEKILNYSRTAVEQYDGVGQQYSWDCGPAAAQVVLQAAGVNKTEDWLIKAIGTTTSGTNHSGLIARVLDELLPGSGYSQGVVWLTQDPPSAGQVNKLFSDVRRSVDASRGTILNFVSPPWNRPRPSYTSTQALQYGGNNTIYHYVAGMGYAIDDAGDRHIWIADPGFKPHGMWCRVSDVARLIVPHSYSFASTAPIVTKPDPVPGPVPNPVPVSKVDQLWLEWNATQYGDPDAVGQIVKAAKAGDARATQALALLERVNPSALQTYITVTKG